MLDERCSFSAYPSCNSTFNIASFIVMIFCLLPYSYIGVLLCYQTNLFRKKKKHHGLLFCFTNLISLFAFSLIFYTRIYGLRLLIDNLFECMRLFQIFAYCIYFTDISRVFLIFSVKGGKIILYASKALEYVLVFLIFVKLITFYVTIPFLSDFITNIITKSNFTFYLVLIVYALSFIILSVIFCFSNMKDFFEKSKVLKLKILIFFIPLIVIIYINIFKWVNSLYYYSKMNTIIFFAKDKTDIYLTRFRWWYQTYWFFIMSLVALLILNLLSFSSNADDDTNNQTDDVIEKSINLEIQY